MVCQSGMWDAGPDDEGGGLALTGSVMSKHDAIPRAALAVRFGHLVPTSTDSRAPF